MSVSTVLPATVWKSSCWRTPAAADHVAPAAALDSGPRDAPRCIQLTSSSPCKLHKEAPAEVKTGAVAPSGGPTGQDGRRACVAGAAVAVRRARELPPSWGGVCMCRTSDWRRFGRADFPRGAVRGGAAARVAGHGLGSRCARPRGMAWRQAAGRGGGACTDKGAQREQLEASVPGRAGRGPLAREAREPAALAYAAGARLAAQSGRVSGQLAKRVCEFSNQRAPAAGVARAS